MSSTIILPPDHDAGTPVKAATLRPDTLPRGSRFPEPTVEKMRGTRLIVLWLALIAGAWAVAAGAVYGLYVLVRPILL